MPSQIKFYQATGDYGFLTNFHKRIFIAEDIKWKTSEHYYQWRKMKFLQSIGESITDEFLQRIIDAKSPMITKNLGHKKCNNVDKWDAIKVEEMKHVVREKFKHPVLRERLLATENAILIEHTSRDAFWGDGGSNGLNMLGKCLMQIRDEIRREIE